MNKTVTTVISECAAEATGRHRWTSSVDVIGGHHRHSDRSRERVSTACKMPPTLFGTRTPITTYDVAISSFLATCLVG